MYLCHSPQKLPSAVRQELWLAMFLVPWLRTDLRVLVDPVVMASDVSLSGGATCRSTDLTAPGLIASQFPAAMNK